MMSILRTEAKGLLESHLAEVAASSGPLEELPPGAVGAVAKWTMQTSLYPNQALAIGAGLATVGKLAARRVAGPLDSTTGLYLCGIAPTGIGKQRPLMIVKSCLMAAGRGDLIGPGSIASMQAVYKRVMTEPFNTLCIIDEFGQELNRLINDVGNMNSASIMRVFNELSTIGWDRFDGIDRAHELAAFAVAPALAVWGVSTPDEFYQLLAAEHVGNGFIGRLLVIPADPKPLKQRDMLPTDVVPEELVYALKDVALIGGQLPNPVGDQARLKPHVRLEWGPGAEAEFDRLVAEMQIGSSQRVRDLQQRVPENTLKIANTIASGRSVKCRGGRWYGTVDLIDLAWGEKLARQSIAAQIEGLDKHAPTLNYQKLCDALHEALQEAPGNWIATRDLERRFGRRNAYRPILDSALEQLKREELIEAFTPPKTGGGRMSPGWRLIRE